MLHYSFSFFETRNSSFTYTTLLLNRKIKLNILPAKRTIMMYDQVLHLQQRDVLLISMYLWSVIFIITIKILVEEKCKAG